MDLGHVAVGAAGDDGGLGDAGDCGRDLEMEVDWVWRIVGSRAADESGDCDSVSIFRGVGCVTRTRRNQTKLEAARDCGSGGHLVLRAVDHSKLCEVPKTDSVAIEFCVRMVDWEQRHFR